MFDYNYFYDNYVTVPSSDVRRFVLTLELNTNSTTITSANGILPFALRNVKLGENGNLGIAIYMLGTNQISKTDFETPSFGFR